MIRLWTGLVLPLVMVWSVGIVVMQWAGRQRLSAPQFAYITECNRWENIALHDLERGLTYCMTQTPSIKEHPAFSPDGSTLAYYNTGTAAFSIKFHAVDTGREWGYTLSNQPFYVNAQQPFTWSPDGTQIALVANTTATNADIYTLEVGTGAIDLIFDGGNYDAYPLWSPVNGDQLVVRSNVQTADIYTFDPVGRRLGNQLARNARALWGANGTLLLYRYDSFTVDVIAPDGVLRQFELMDARWADASMAPDGDEVAVLIQEPSNSNLYRIDTHTGDAEPITNHAFYKGQPAWSPDGRWIAYVAVPGGRSDEIMLHDLRSGRTRQLTDNTWRDWYLVWRPQR